MPLGGVRAGDVIRTVKYHGVPALLLRVLIKALSPVGELRLMVLCEKDLSQPVPDPRPRVDIEITNAGEADIDNLLSLMVQGAETVGPVGRLQALDWLLQDFREGGLCFVAKHGETWVHCNWIKFPGSTVLTAPGRFLRLQPDEAYMTDGFTAKPWRGQGIHAAVNCTMLRYLQAHGYRKAYTQVALQNISSRKGLARVGWLPTGIMLAFTAPGQRVWIHPVRGRLEPWVEERPPATRSRPHPFR